MPQSHILFYYLKKKKKKYARVAGHPLSGGSATPTYIYFLFCFLFFVLDFFKNKIKYVMGAFWKKKKGSKWSNCHNLKVWGVKCHI
jgi:hypothetical protein